MHLDAGTAIHERSRYAAVTPPYTVYLLGGSGALQVRGRAIFFVIYTLINYKKYIRTWH